MTRKLTSLLLVIAMLMSLTVPIRAEGTVRFSPVDNDRVTATPTKEVSQPEARTYAPDETVRVSVVLEEQPGQLRHHAQQKFLKQQTALTASIEKTLARKLDVVWNLTTAANVLSANVRFGEIPAIEAVDGVKEVILETRYVPQEAVESTVGLPNMTVSSQMTGTNIAWSSGYTGAGMRVAIIDTGLDWDHQSMDPAAYLHAMEENAAKEGKPLEQYLTDEQVATREEIAGVLPELHMHRLNPGVTAEDLYLNAKVPFAYNYVDMDLDVTHDYDGLSDHGSHVAGIAAANRYLRRDGVFVDAADTVGMLGNAPDAQIFVMKVFGKNGGAYDSDYMAAIEDAIVMGCDAVNLSLGSVAPGFTTNSYYRDILENLTKSDTVVSISAGNSGEWGAYTVDGKLYADGGVNYHTGGAPGTYPTALTVASAENDGSVGEAFTAAGKKIVYGETLYSNRPFRTLDPSGTGTDYEYVLLDGVGRKQEYEGVDVKSKVVFVSRGEIQFHEKANIAAELGAAAVAVYNTEPGIVSMILTDYKYTNPVVMISSEDVPHLRANAENHGTYYTGTLSVDHKAGGVYQNAPYKTMSQFSSWGVPGNLSMKPEITAPGGNIYSLSGSTAATNEYQLMSGTSMAAPQITGISALVKQYIEENNLSQPGLTDRALVQSLLMSTAKPMEYEAGHYYPVLQQGAGLVDTRAAASADSFVLVEGQPDGKVKAELLDDPQRLGSYTVSFDLHNLTDKPQSYALSASFFTQAVNGIYLENTTVPLAAQFQWTENGAVSCAADTALDFNGDGRTDDLDADALLDYVNEVRSSIFHMESADLSGDGKITSYDVHLFLNRPREDSLTVPAGGKVSVTAQIRLEDRQALEEAYPTGAYVEGYIFVDSLGDAEGKAGTSHSIPVLGYYGSWTDADMFDVGTYQTNWGGQEKRMPYLGNADINSFLITYDREPRATQFFGGNPILQDDRYYPERNAINSQKGDYISSLQVSPIRSGAATRITAENMTTGEKLYDDFYTAQLQGAYFDTGVGIWMEAVRNVPITCVPSSMKEGEQLHCGYILLPELYVDQDDRVDWSQAGPGARIDTYAAVDNSDPQVLSVRQDNQNHDMIVEVQDNRYIAGVLLYNSTGNQLLASESGKPDAQEGQAVTYHIDTSKINGSTFLLQVCDYARNILTYELELEVGAGHAKLPLGVAYDVRKGCWMGFDASTGEGNHLGKFADSPQNFRAATMAGHHIFAVTDQGSLYVLSEEDLTQAQYVRNLGIVFEDLAYNIANDTIYGISRNVLYTIDKLTGQTSEVGALAMETNTLACDAKGTFYAAACDSRKVYSFTLDTLSAPQLLLEVQMMRNSTGIQSMETDLDTGLVYWISHFEEPGWNSSESYSPFYEIDPAGKTYRRLGDLKDEMAAFVVQYDGEKLPWEAPVQKPEGVAISETSLTILKGNGKRLQAAAYPWTLTDCGVLWSSDDEYVATVDQSGHVRAQAPGICTLTAASALDQSVLARCRITVEDTALTVSGVLGNRQNQTIFFTWDLQNQPKFSANVFAQISLASATYDPVNGSAYIVDNENGSNLVHRVDPTTGQVAESAPANLIGWPLWDLAYNPYFSTPEQPLISGITREMLIPASDPMKMEYKGISFGSQLTGYNLAAVASGGYERIFDGQAQVYRDTEHLYVIDDMGFVFDVWIYRNDQGGISSIVKKTATDFDKGFPGATHTLYMYCSLVVGDDGNLYLSHFDRHTSTLFRLCYNEKLNRYESDFLASFENGVWPASLFSVTTNSQRSAAHPSPDSVDTFRLDAVTLPQPGPKPVQNCQDHQAVLPLTAETLTTNGRISVSYDSRQLKLVSANINADVDSLLEREGEAVIAFASRIGVPAETVLGKLTFEVLGSEDAPVTLTVLEENDTQPGRTKTVKISAPRHDYEKTVVEPTCTEGGYTRYTCRLCGHSYIADETPALGHDWTAWETVEPADCQHEGRERRTCSRCGETENRVIPKTEHDYQTQVVEPDCTHGGYTEYVCSVCGDRYRDHEVPALGHDWSDWEVVEPADCQHEGEEIRHCNRCWETENRVIPKTEHQYEAKVVQPTCTEKGYTIYTCTVCGDTYKDDFVPALGHNWSDWTVTKEATCLQDGEESRTCSRCGETETRVIPGGEHKYEAFMVAPTCTEKGYTVYTCTVCGDTYKDDFVPALGHDWSQWEVSREPDCFHTGEERRTCGRCGQQESRVLPKTSSNCPSRQFRDLSPSKWYHEGVDFVLHRGLMKGLQKDIFGPYENVDRAQLVTMLYRLAGSPGVSGREPFRDVYSGDYFYRAVLWAYQEGITTGISATRFDPHGEITRDQLVTFLARYAASTGMDIRSNEDLSRFPDYRKVSGYARQAMAWAVEHKLVEGTGKLLEPQATALRAQIAVIFQRYCETFGQ